MSITRTLTGILLLSLVGALQAAQSSDVVIEMTVERDGEVIEDSAWASAKMNESEVSFSVDDTKLEMSVEPFDQSEDAVMLNITRQESGSEDSEELRVATRYDEAAKVSVHNNGQEYAFFLTPRRPSETDL